MIATGAGLPPEREGKQRARISILCATTIELQFGSFYTYEAEMLLGNGLSSDGWRALHQPLHVVFPQALPTRRRCQTHLQELSKSLACTSMISRQSARLLTLQQTCSTQMHQQQAAAVAAARWTLLTRSNIHTSGHKLP